MGYRLINLYARACVANFQNNAPNSLIGRWLGQEKRMPIIRRKLGTLPAQVLIMKIATVLFSLLHLVLLNYTESTLTSENVANPSKSVHTMQNLLSFFRATTEHKKRPCPPSVRFENAPQSTKRQQLTKFFFESTNHERKRNSSVNDVPSTESASKECNAPSADPAITAPCQLKSSKKRSKARRKRLSAAKLREQQADFYEIKNELAHFRCCTLFKCYEWLTAQLILFCRSFYAVLENRRDQISWLHKTLDEMPQNENGGLQYSINNMGTGAQRCCSKAWRFAYGVAHSTLKRHFKHNRNGSPNNKKLHSMRGMSKRMFLVVWLNEFAKRVGCKIPYVEGIKATGIRLPFPTKHHVYEVYKAECKDKHGMSPVSLHKFLKIWNECPDLEAVKCAKGKIGFAKCNFCEPLKLQMKRQLSADQRKGLNAKYSSHIEESWLEKAQYYKARDKARNFPSRYLSIIMDAMDQRKTCVPFFASPPKCIQSIPPYEIKLTGCLAHGIGTYLFWAGPEIQKTTSYNIECLRRTLKKS